MRESKSGPLTPTPTCFNAQPSRSKGFQAGLEENLCYTKVGQADDFYTTGYFNCSNVTLGENLESSWRIWQAYRFKISPKGQEETHY